jgi:hypothetical protein
VDQIYWCVWLALIFAATDELGALTVYGLYLADLVQTVFITDVAWTTFCKGWGNPSALVTTDWGFAMTPVVSGLSKRCAVLDLMSEPNVSPFPFVS